MANVTIKAVTGDERRDVVQWMGGYAFSAAPPLNKPEETDRWLQYREDATVLALFEGDDVRATAASSPMRHHLRGKLYPMGGVWLVATHPQARRNGYAKRVIGDLLRAVREGGAPFTTLYPFRESFYQRLGYVTYPQPQQAAFKPRPLLPLLEQDFGGRVELLSAADGADAYYAYLEAQLNRQHGMALFTRRAYGTLTEYDSYWIALARDDGGELLGAMQYKHTGHLGAFTMEVPRFYAHDARGLYLFLEWFARHVDQANEIKVKLPPDARPGTWFADLNPKLEAQEPAMGRVLDVAQIGGMAAGQGDFTAQISDPLCPWNEGVFRFVGDDGALVVEPSTAAPDCHLTIQGLTALVYGAHDPATFAIRGWGDPSPALQAALRRLFPAMLPYIHETF